MACDDAIAWDGSLTHAKILATVLDEGIPFFETAFIQQNLNAFARGQFAFGMLYLNALLPAA